MKYLRNEFGSPKYAYACYDGEPKIKNLIKYISESEYLKIVKGYSYKFIIFMNGANVEYLTDDLGLTDDGTNILELIHNENLEFKRCTI